MKKTIDLNLARRIDFWVGIPASLLVSGIHKLEAMFRSRVDGEGIAPKKILFLELSEMGSAILACSAILKAKQLYPEARLYFWIFMENAESVALSGLIPEENIITIRTDGLWTMFLDTFRALRCVRREGMDVIIDLELFSRFTSLLVYLGGAKQRVGFHKFSMEGLSRADVYTRKVMYNAYMHMSRNFLSLVLALREPAQTIPLLKLSLAQAATEAPRLLPDAGRQAKIRVKLESIKSEVSPADRLILLNFGLGDRLPLRVWPLENSLELGKRLLEEDGVFVVLLGVQHVRGADERIRKFSTRPRVIDMFGRTSIPEVVDLCGISRLLISHDCGIAHLASLTALDTVVLFGPETPALYAPLNPNMTVIYKNFACSPCLLAYNHRKSVCRDNSCLKAISVDEVYAAAMSRLRRRPAAAQ